MTIKIKPAFAGMTSSAILALFNRDDSRDLTTERLCCWGCLSRYAKEPQP
ncbi:hypothetical protein SAMN05720758_1472 [Fibrobacter sp. UWB11]|nr:hypothetical protein SAMN05720758_1472 [Fibrobacter sp. UWB11]